MLKTLRQGRGMGYNLSSNNIYSMTLHSCLGDFNIEKIDISSKYPKRHTIITIHSYNLEDIWNSWSNNKDLKLSVTIKGSEYDTYISDLDITGMNIESIKLDNMECIASSIETKKKSLINKTEKGQNWEIDILISGYSKDRVPSIREVLAEVSDNPDIYKESDGCIFGTDTFISEESPSRDRIAKAILNISNRSTIYITTRENGKKGKTTVLSSVSDYG